MLRSARGNNGNRRTAPDRGGKPAEGEAAASAEVASIACYIADMSAELAGLAGRSQLPMLAYFLNLARVEAEMRSRSFTSDLARAEAERLRNN